MKQGLAVLKLEGTNRMKPIKEMDWTGLKNLLENNHAIKDDIEYAYFR